MFVKPSSSVRPTSARDAVRDELLCGSAADDHARLGHITLAEVRAYQQELGQRPEFDPTWAHVVDARDAVQFDLSTNEIRQLAETSVLAPSARRAMVATDLAIFGLFRMYGTLFELHVDGTAVGVFTTLDDAIEWVTP